MLTCTRDKPVTLKQSIRNKINKAVRWINRDFHDAIPLNKIFEAMNAVGVTAVDEAGDPWQGLLCGREGRALFDLAMNDGTPIKNAALFISWYKMDSGRYEMVVYVS